MRTDGAEDEHRIGVIPRRRGGVVRIQEDYMVKVKWILALLMLILIMLEVTAIALYFVWPLFSVEVLLVPVCLFALVGFNRGILELIRDVVQKM